MFVYTRQYAQDYGLLLNRIGIVNQLHGCKYAQASDNPMTMRKVRGCYVVSYLGDDLVQFRANDCEGLRNAYALVDSLSRTLWLVRRAGLLKPVDVV